jgi:hypothetical protein
MGTKSKTWMWAVGSEMVSELDLLAVGSGLSRPDFARKVLAQGLLMEKYLQSEGVKAVAQQLNPQKTSKPSEPKARITLTDKSEAQPVPQKSEKSSKFTGLEDCPPMLHANINEDASSSPANEPAASDPAQRASKPADAPKPVLKSPFEALNDEAPAKPAPDPQATPAETLRARYGRLQGMWAELHQSGMAKDDPRLQPKIAEAVALQKIIEAELDARQRRKTATTAAPVTTPSEQSLDEFMEALTE